MSNIEEQKEISIKDVLAAKWDAIAFDSLINWRMTILNRAVIVLTTPAQELMQVGVGMWGESSKLTYPKKSEVHALPNGCLVFNSKVRNSNIHFSLWMVFGELRVGVKIPKHMVENNTNDKISKCYDGSRCARIQEIGDDVLFDWIFRDGFASFDSMSKGFRDPMITAAIATRVGEILTHVYLSVMSICSEEPKTEILAPSHPGKSHSLRYEVAGDFEAFKLFISERNCKYVECITEGDRTIHIIDAPENVHFGLGEYHDGDGGLFFIV